MRDVFHLWSKEGSIGFLAFLLQREGYRVTWQPHAPGTEHLLRGYVPRAAPPPHAITIFDDVGHGGVGDLYRARGAKVIGGHPIDRDFELDRKRGAEIANAAGIALPPTYHFTDIRRAIHFLERTEGSWFVKPSGNKDAGTSKEKSSAKMIRFLRWAQRHDAHDFENFLLQQEIKGLEIDVNGFFNGHEFVRPFFWTLEDKRFMDGDIGPQIGCAASLVGAWRSALPKLIQQTIISVEPILAVAGYVGDCACNLIIDDAGVPHFLEWTLRIGFSAFQAFVLLLEPDTVGEQLSAFARGHLARWDLAKATRALTVCLTIPPFPVCDKQLLRELHELPLDERLDGSHPRVLPFDVQRGDDGPILAASNGMLAEVAAVGDDVPSIRSSALALCDDLDVRSKQHRRQLVQRYERAIGVLTNFGYDDGAFPASAPAPPKEKAA